MSQWPTHFSKVQVRTRSSVPTSGVGRHDTRPSSQRQGIKKKKINLSGGSGIAESRNVTRQALRGVGGLTSTGTNKDKPTHGITGYHSSLFGPIGKTLEKYTGQKVRKYRTHSPCLQLSINPLSQPLVGEYNFHDVVSPEADRPRRSSGMSSLLLSGRFPDVEATQHACGTRVKNTRKKSETKTPQAPTHLSRTQAHLILEAEPPFGCVAIHGSGAHTTGGETDTLIEHTKEKCILDDPDLVNSLAR